MTAHCKELRLQASASEAAKSVKLGDMAKRENFDFELSFFKSLHKRMPKDVRVASILAHLYTQTGQIDLG